MRAWFPSLERPRVTMVWVLGAVVAACLPTLWNDFVYDDTYVIVWGDVIHDVRNLPSLFLHHAMFVSKGAQATYAVDTYRPLSVATFMWDSALSGHAPIAYHVTNLVAHVCAVALVYALARRVLPDEHRAFAPLSAAWFGLSPLPGEAHLWVNGRSDVFCAIFLVAAALAWERATSGTRRRVPLWIGAGALYLASLLCKEIALMALPALVLWPRARAVRARAIDASVFGVAAAVYLAMRVAALGGVRTHEGTSQLGHAFSQLGILLLDGARELFAPSRVYLRSLVDDYAGLSPLWLGLAWTVVVVVSAAALWARRRQPVLAWGWLWFTCTLAPAAIISTMQWVGFGRFLYVPAVGLSIALAVVLGSVFKHLGASERLVRFRGPMLWLLALYVAFLGVRLHLFAYDFRDSRSLYGAIIADAPDQAHGYGFLGISLVDRGRAAEAIPWLVRADEISHTAGPRYLAALMDAYALSGDDARALACAERLIARFRPASDYRYAAYRALFKTNPERASGYLVDCLLEEPDHRNCSAAPATALAEPTLGPRYRAELSAILARRPDPRLAPLRHALDSH